MLVFKIIICMLCLILINCASLKNYFMNRAYDLRDIGNIGVEENVYGGGIYIDSLILGLSYNVDGEGYGLRFGHLGKYKTGKEDAFSSNFYRFNEIQSCKEANVKKTRNIGGNFLIFFGSNYHEAESALFRNHKKMLVNVNETAVIFLSSSKVSSGRTNVICYKDIQANTFLRDSYVVLPIEVSVGFLFGIRLGFNPHELLDFMVGIVGFDLLDDDISNTEPIYRELPQPVKQNKMWEENLEKVDKKFPKVLTPEWERDEKKNSSEANQSLEATNMEEGFCSSKKDFPKCDKLTFIAKCELTASETIFYIKDRFSVNNAEKNCELRKGKFVW